MLVCCSKRQSEDAQLEYDACVSYYALLRKLLCTCPPNQPIHKQSVVQVWCSRFNHVDRNKNELGATDGTTHSGPDGTADDGTTDDGTTDGTADGTTDSGPTDGTTDDGTTECTTDSGPTGDPTDDSGPTDGAPAVVSI